MLLLVSTNIINNFGALFMKIRYKLSLPIVGLILLFFTIILFFVSFGLSSYSDIAHKNLKETLVEGHKKELKTATELASSLISDIFRIEGISEDEKLELARESIGPLRFGNGEYFYAYRKGSGVNLIHGQTPSNEGKSLWDLQSPDGEQFIIRDLDKAAGSGNLFVEFYWSKPGEDQEKVFPKLGTAMMVPGTDIWVGTGVYIDDIEVEITSINSILTEAGAAMQRNLLFIMLAALLILFFLILTLIRGVIAPVSALSRIAADSGGTDFSVIPEVRTPLTPDETTVLEESFSTLFLSFSDVLREVIASVTSSTDSGSLMYKSLTEINKALEESGLAFKEIEASETQLSNEAASNLTLSVNLKDFIEGTAKLASEQTDSVRAAADYIGALQNRVKMIAGNIEEYNGLTSELDSSAREGEKRISAAVEYLEEADAAAGNINKAIAMISDITERTNILAINASIEAARAGQAGEGFAVVANEIRALAANSRVNMEQIAQQLNQIAQSIVASRETTVQADESFREIGQLSRRVIDGNSRLSTNNQVIQQMSGEVDGVLGKLTVQSEETGRSSVQALDKVRELSTSASELTQLSLNLQNTMNTVEKSYASIRDKSALILERAEENNRNMEILSVTVGQFRLAEKTLSA